MLKWMSSCALYWLNGQDMTVLDQITSEVIEAPTPEAKNMFLKLVSDAKQGARAPIIPGASVNGLNKKQWMDVIGGYDYGDLRPPTDEQLGCEPAMINGSSNGHPQLGSAMMNGHPQITLSSDSSFGNFPGNYGGYLLQPGWENRTRNITPPIPPGVASSASSPIPPLSTGSAMGCSKRGLDFGNTNNKKRKTEINTEVSLLMNKKFTKMANNHWATPIDDYKPSGGTPKYMEFVICGETNRLSDHKHGFLLVQMFNTIMSLTQQVNVLHTHINQLEDSKPPAQAATTGTEDSDSD